MKGNNTYEALFMCQALFLGAFIFIISFNPQNKILSHRYLTNEETEVQRS